ncbi:hypothetical protein ACHAQJ_010518 [Trichoderma viride]
MSPPTHNIMTPEPPTSDSSILDNIPTPNGYDPCVSLSPKSVQLPDDDNACEGFLEKGQKANNVWDVGHLCGISIPHSEPAYWTPYLSHDDYRLLHHFNTVVSTLISVKPTDNLFQQHFISMALQEGPLQSAIFSVAASHLEAILPHKNSETIASKHHQAAIQSLSLALKDPVERLSDAILAAILMLQVRRQFVGNVDEADDCHLSAAGELIHLRGGLPAALTSCSRFLFNLFNYHDILGSIAHARAPFILGHHQLYSHTTTLPSGDTFNILHVASDISMLQPMKCGNASAEEIQSFIQTLEYKLEMWRVPDSVTEDIDLVNTAIAYHAAASIYLFRVAYNIGAPHPRTLHRVRLCLDALAKIPITSPLMSMHVWPLFTGGCEAIDPQDRLFAVRRFEEMYSYRRMSSLIRVREAMETVWQCKDLEGGGNRPDRMAKLGCLEALDHLGLRVDLV